MAARIGNMGLNTDRFTNGPVKVNFGSFSLATPWASSEFASSKSAALNNQWAVANQLAGQADVGSKVAASIDRTIGLAKDYATQDRAEGIANYNDDRNRFYAGQEAANQAKLGAYNTNVGWINQDRARYAQVFQPLEDRLAALATPTAAAYDQAAGRAAADVAQSFASQRGQMAREAARLGVSPTSGRYADMMASGGLSETAALTGALSTARKSVDDRADTALKAGLDVGQRYRQTQQVTAPELDYKVMGPREANGLERNLPDLLSKEAELRIQAENADVDRVWAYFMQMTK